jgi:hypothetical protein
MRPLDQVWPSSLEMKAVRLFALGSGVGGDAHVLDQQQISGLQAAEVEAGGGVSNGGNVERTPGKAAIGGTAFADAQIGAQEHPEGAVLALHRHRFGGSQIGVQDKLTFHGEGLALVP